MIALALAAALVAPQLPNPALTPGAINPAISPAAVCTVKWGKDERHVTAAMKAQVFKEYGFSGPHDPAFAQDAAGRTVEIDHLISRELAGAELWRTCGLRRGRRSPSTPT